MVRPFFVSVPVLTFVSGSAGILVANGGGSRVAVLCAELLGEVVVPHRGLAHLDPA